MHQSDDLTRSYTAVHADWSVTGIIFLSWVDGQSTNRLERPFSTVWLHRHGKVSRRDTHPRPDQLGQCVLTSHTERHRFRAAIEVMVVIVVVVLAVSIAVRGESPASSSGSSSILNGTRNDDHDRKRKRAGKRERERDEGGERGRGQRDRVDLVGYNTEFGSTVVEESLVNEPSGWLILPKSHTRGLPPFAVVVFSSRREEFDNHKRQCISPSRQSCLYGIAECFHHEHHGCSCDCSCSCS